MRFLVKSSIVFGIFLLLVVLSKATELKFPSGSEITLNINTNNTIWALISNVIQPVDAGNGLKVPSLAGLDCIGTDADGDFQTGTCGGSSSVVIFTYNNITAYLGSGGNNSLIRDTNTTFAERGNVTNNNQIANGAGYVT